MSKIIVVMDDGEIRNIITDMKKEVEYLVVDFSAVYLDKPLCKVLVEPFSDYAAIANVFDIEVAAYDPVKVAEIHQEWEVSRKKH